MSVVNRYSITNPDFLNIDNIKKYYILDYIKKFEFYLIAFKWKLHFSYTIVSVISDTWYNFSTSYFVLSKLNIMSNVDINSLIYLK